MGGTLAPPPDPCRILGSPRQSLTAAGTILAPRKNAAVSWLGTLVDVITDQNTGRESSVGQRFPLHGAPSLQCGVHKGLACLSSFIYLSLRLRVDDACA